MVDRYNDYAPLIHVLDVRREDASLHVSTACRKKHIVGMPVDRKDGGANGLLQQP